MLGLEEVFMFVLGLDRVTLETSAQSGTRDVTVRVRIRTRIRIRIGIMDALRMRVGSGALRYLDMSVVPCRMVPHWPWLCQHQWVPRCSSLQVGTQLG